MSKYIYKIRKNKKNEKKDKKFYIARAIILINN